MELGYVYYEDKNPFIPFNMVSYWYGKQIQAKV